MHRPGPDARKACASRHLHSKVLIQDETENGSRVRMVHGLDGSVEAGVWELLLI